MWIVRNSWGFQKLRQVVPQPPIPSVLSMKSFIVQIICFHAMSEWSVHLPTHKGRIKYSRAPYMFAVVEEPSFDTTVDCTMSICHWSTALRNAVSKSTVPSRLTFILGPITTDFNNWNLDFNHWKTRVEYRPVKGFCCEENNLMRLGQRRWVAWHQ